MKLLLRYKLEIVIFLILIAAYFILRIPNLTLQPIFADEAIYIRWAQVMKSEPTLRFLPQTDGKTPLFMWILIPLFKFIKDPLLAGRFLSVISGFFTLLGVFVLSKKVFNLRVAFWASLIYVVTPYTVFFDRMALVDSMLAAFTIWIVYFAIWLAETKRLDLAMILGYLMGGAILTKTPGLINLLILPFSIFSYKRTNKNSLVKLILLWLVAIGIALVMYNMLRLGPEFQKLSQRNTDYVFSPMELIGRPLDPFIPHFNDMKDWFPKFFTVPILLLVFSGIFFALKMNRKSVVIVLLWLLIPMLISMAFLKTFTARYLLTSIAPMLIFAGFGLTHILEKIQEGKIRVFLGLIIVLPMALIFDFQLINNPPPNSLPKEERKGYFEEWTAGYGLKEIATFLLKENKKQKIVLGTEGFFGTLPDGIYIYLDKSNISIVGSHATVSAQIRNAAADNLTYFVGNKKDLESSIRNVKLIMEFPKSKSENGLMDATVLYQVFP